MTRLGRSCVIRPGQAIAGQSGSTSDVLVAVQQPLNVHMPLSLGDLVRTGRPVGLGAENCGRIRRAERVSEAGSVRPGPLATGPGGSRLHARGPFPPALTLRLRL
jgi:hypothetical protein